jgi:3-hydroxyisobutyrate dehydrogenase-like beta-hydroxyacid dehydrogenase
MEESIAIINTLAQSVDSPTPMLDTAAQYYKEAIAAGLGEKDGSSMYAFMEQMTRQDKSREEQI